MLRHMLAVAALATALPASAAAQDAALASPELTIAIRPALASGVDGLDPVMDLVRESLSAGTLGVELAAFGVEDEDDIALVRVTHRGAAPAWTRASLHADLDVNAVADALDAAERWTRDGDAWTFGDGRLSITDGLLQFAVGNDRPEASGSTCAACVLEVRYDPSEATRAAHPELAALESVVVELRDDALTLRASLADGSDAGAVELRSAIERAAAMPEVAALGIGPVLEQATVALEDATVVVTLPATGPAWSSLMETVESLVEAELR